MPTSSLYSTLHDCPSGFGGFNPNLHHHSSDHHSSVTCDDNKLSVLEGEEERMTGKSKADNSVEESGDEEIVHNKRMIFFEEEEEEESHEEIVFRKRYPFGFGYSKEEEKEGLVGKTKVDNLKEESRDEEVVNDLMEENHEEVVYRKRKYSAVRDYPPEVGPNQHKIVCHSQDSVCWSCADYGSDCFEEEEEEEVNEEWEEEEDEEARHDELLMEECGKRRKFVSAVRDYPPGIGPNRHTTSKFQDFDELWGCDEEEEEVEASEAVDWEAMQREIDEYEAKLRESKREELLMGQSFDENGCHCSAVRHYPPACGPHHRRYIASDDTESSIPDGYFSSDDQDYEEEEEMERLVEEEEARVVEEEELMKKLE